MTSSSDAVPVVAAGSGRGRSSNTSFNSDQFITRAQQIVVENFNAHRKPDRSPELTTDGVNIVWFTKALISDKAILMSPLAKGLLWEVTYNRVKNEVYLDVYGKLNNVKISMGADSES